MGELLLLVNNDAGVPHPVGSGLAELTSAGIVPRGKNQILIKSEVHSVAYTPPLLSLKPLPKVMFELSVMEHPNLGPVSIRLKKNMVYLRCRVCPTVRAYQLTTESCPCIGTETWAGMESHLVGHEALVVVSCSRHLG